MILNAMDKFFQTFSLAFGYYGGNTKDNKVSMYVPAILTMSYSGFYVYHMNQISDGANTFLEHTLTPKQYYSININDLNINFTLDDFIRVNKNLTLDGIDSEEYTNVYGVGKTFGEVYEMDSSNPIYARDIGEIDGFSGINNYDVTELMNVANIIGLADLDLDRSTIVGNIYYNHMDLSEYYTYAYCDINQDGYIDAYDINILQDYINNSGHSFKEVNEGRIVDIRHKRDITSSNGLYRRSNTVPINYNGINYQVGDIIYEKSFYTLGGVRYLLEEWFEDLDDDNLATYDDDLFYLYRRMTPYTEEDYQFTVALESEINSPIGVTTYNYLFNGNPENKGFTNPLTGEYEIGLFEVRRREIITRQVTEQLEHYVMKHNQYATAYGVTYNFILPEVTSTDWNNALNDITIMAFVQGIPILNQQYYNNYGISGSNIIDKDFYIRCRTCWRIWNK